MSGHSKIPWTETTLNPWTGCTPVSAGCKYCFAKAHAHRFWGERNFDELRFYPERLQEPYRWRKPRMCLVCSMSDPFHPQAVAKGWTDALWEMMTDERLQQHTFQVLTKRSLGALDYLDDNPRFSPPDGWDNIWLGVSCENHTTANERIPLLLQISAALRFVSLEPLLRPVELRYGIPGWERCMQCGRILRMPRVGHARCDCVRWRGARLDSRELFPLDALSWVIVGAESRNGRPGRRCENEWIQTIIQHCEWDRVPIFVKQLHHEGRLVKDPAQMAAILGTSVDRIQQWPDSRKAD